MACRSNAPIVLVPAVLSLTKTCPTTGDEELMDAEAAAGTATAAAAARARISAPTPPRVIQLGCRPLVRLLDQLKPVEPARGECQQIRQLADPRKPRAARPIGVM